MADPQPPLNDDEARRATDSLAGVLRARRDQLGGVAGSPADDQAVSERILAAARERSARITGAARRPSSTATVTDPGRPIPWWLWLAWVLAVAGAVAAWKLLA